MAQDKNLTPKKSTDQKARQTQASTNHMKAHNSRTQHRSKPGQASLTAITSSQLSGNRIFANFKTKKLTNQIRAVSRPSYEYLCRHCLEALEFNNLP